MRLRMRRVWLSFHYLAPIQIDSESFPDTMKCFSRCAPTGIGDAFFHIF
ncbi:hypothetical protein O59_004251 [Cellvibrio sp. BR]|nr:hypothetical protein O59_004251 [Cellvibrio sp. BR]